MTEPLPLEILKVHKKFKTGFLNLRSSVAVEDLSLSLRSNEIVGLLGPNGAGKTTTLKMVTGLIFPTAGRIRLFGEPVDTRVARARMGFLPENPYFYDYLTAEEFLHMTCGLADMPLAGRSGRVARMLRKLDIWHARALPMRKFSKGMLQRAGLAAALIHDPDLVILDEPLSGLDPIGRRDFREIILELKKNGKTVLFSSHILPDVEDLCDRVAIIVKGRLREEGSLSTLLEQGTRNTDIEIACPAGRQDQLASDFPELDRGATLSGFRLGVPTDVNLQEILRRLVKLEFEILSVRPHRISLEDLFVTTADVKSADEKSADEAVADGKPDDGVKEDVP
ncbi:ABC transporter ATP-binding protein [Myxococcota bacterium]|nr:ABC transporter ATP-binding protein [Myxococcota bacterium]MBU1512223.1 ABC transporter ATP-binding protein [Myxococcota bacterium]